MLSSQSLGESAQIFAGELYGGGNGGYGTWIGYDGDDPQVHYCFSYCLVPIVYCLSLIAYFKYIIHYDSWYGQRAGCVEQVNSVVVAYQHISLLPVALLPTCLWPTVFPCYQLPSCQLGEYMDD